MTRLKTPPSPAVEGRDQDADAVFRLAAIVESSSDAIIGKTLEGVITSWNRGAQHIFGYTPDEVIGRDVSILIPPDRLGEETRILDAVGKGVRVEHYETVRRRKDGTDVDISLTVSPVLDANGRVIGASKIARDITEQKRAKEAARESEEQFRSLANNIAQFTWIADAQGEIYWYNKRWYEYTGTTFEEAQGRGWTKFHHPDHVERAVEKFEASLLSGEPWEDVFPLRGKDGEYRWFLSHALPIRDKSGRIVRWLGTNTDVTEQRNAEEALRHGAMHDALTDLPNRAYFVERLAQAFARMQRDSNYRIAVLLLDCDGFKSINDTMGHLAGDKFLTEIGARLRTSVRPGDVVARLGGDEFTVLLEDVTGPSDAEQAARHIQEALAAPIVLDDRPVVATVSIGAALSDAEHGRPRDLLHHADLAMYHAKRKGRGRFQLFDAALRDSAKARVDMETDLREAVERKQFRLVFQPMVELEAGRVRGVEALLRWRRPRREAVTPLDIVAGAEQTGLILQVGRWVLHEACRNARVWQDASPVSTSSATMQAATPDSHGGAARLKRVSVNLSAKQFWDEELVTDVRDALQQHGVSPSALILEVPERVLVSNVEAARAVLKRLRALGVGVLIDDFGTASSLLHLSRFPVEGIKLDGVLVHRIGSRRTEHSEVLRSIMDLARSLGLAVTAESVETAVQRDRLLGLGCELGQGYLFAKPLEQKDAGALLTRAA